MWKVKTKVKQDKNVVQNVGPNLKHSKVEVFFIDFVKIRGK